MQVAQSCAGEDCGGELHSLWSLPVLVLFIESLTPVLYNRQRNTR